MSEGTMDQLFLALHLAAIARSVIEADVHAECSLA